MNLANPLSRRDFRSFSPPAVFCRREVTRVVRNVCARVGESRRPLGRPNEFRLLMQPAVAIFFAVRAGIRDARENKPTFLRCALSNPSSWRARMRLSWKDVGTVFIVAAILDAIYQIVVHSGIFAVELLITATLLALVPYMVMRDLVSRVARWFGVGKQTEHSLTSEKETRT